MQIKFHNTLYDLITSPNILPTTFEASIEKGDHSYDSIVEDTTNVEEIIVYDDEGEIKGIYDGYTQRIAFYIIDDYISISFANTDLEAQINDLAKSLAHVEDEQETQAHAITNLGESVDSLNQANDTQDLAIEDLGTAVDDLADSQATQDLAIEDLGEAVSNLEGE